MKVNHSALKQRRTRLHHSAGQMTIEMILLMTIFLSVGLWVSRTATGTGLIADLVESPWLHVQGMIEDGVWMRAGASKSQHPHLIDRHGSPEGDDVE